MRPVLEILVEVTPTSYRAIYFSECEQFPGCRTVQEIIELDFANNWKGKFEDAGRFIARWPGQDYRLVLHEGHEGHPFGRRVLISSRIALLLSAAGDGVDQQLEEGTLC